jgi:hypothetical protein
MTAAHSIKDSCYYHAVQAHYFRYLEQKEVMAEITSSQKDA